MRLSAKWGQHFVETLEHSNTGIQPARDWRWLLVVAWAALALSADLKVFVHPRIHWFTSVITLVPVFLSCRQTLGLGRIRFMAPVLLYCGAIVLTAFFSGQASYDLLQAAKVALIFVLSLPLMFNAQLSDAAFTGIKVATVLNAILLILGILGVEDVGRLMAVNRWGTILNMPGSLSRLGILPFAYAAYGLFRKGRLVWKNLVLLAASIFVAVMDGSRTAALGLLLGTTFVAAISFWKRGAKATWRMLAMVMPLLALAVLFAPGEHRVAQLGQVFIGNSTSPEASNGGATTNGVSSEISNGGATRSSALEAIDDTRWGMIQTALAAVLNHPIVGTGMGTTTHPTRTGPMVVHMAYLQIWADAGLLGFIGYCWIVFGWLALIPPLLRRVNLGKEEEGAERVVGAAFMLLYYAWVGLFHPISSEWSEWATYLIPLSMLLTIVEDEPMPGLARRLRGGRPSH